jgi:quercetin dioxygenase-like cupin family protein
MVIDNLSSGVVYVALGKGTVYKMVTVPYFILLNSSQTNGQFMMMKGRINVGEGPPAHTHTREDEVFYVLEGKLEFQIGNDTVQARKGATLYAPRGVRHTFRNPGPGPARLLFFFSPGGIEGYFREASRYLTEDPPNFTKATAVGAKYGIQFFDGAIWSG